MSIRAFVLGVVLLALVGFCMLQESIKQTQARYDLAELTRREDEMKQRLVRMRTREQELRSPSHLRHLAREKCPDLVALGSVAPQPMGDAMARRPGEVAEDRLRESGNGAEVARVGQR